MKKIVLTGGGSAGHVTPNIALIPALKKAGYEIYYIGSYNGIEKKLIEDYNIPYFGIATGKLRRYFDPKNFTDPFRVLKGFTEAVKLLKRIKPDVVFSKGGFVSVPVVRAAGALKIPYLVHESDMTPGLANKLSMSGAKKICCNFPETMRLLPADKAVLTGTPIREELGLGDKEVGKKLCGFEDDKPVLMVIGGSLGAQSVNETVRYALPRLLPYFNVVHICGKEKMDNLKLTVPGYKQFEYVKNELKDIFAMADIVVSRAGANSICELLALKKPNILIPLSTKSSRGDQMLNARSFEQQGFSLVIDNDDLDEDILVETIEDLYKNREKFIENMNKSNLHSATNTIVKLIDEQIQ
ncbi:undecaprenyldiphospho-muramoylpentapeptide beta-N-acetylglucosaminyltransferase [Butyrivibrio sp.]|uniref:undecaprenyldiphospho-muramoylpentapeptide beta-N-acetylglucosaminyltransferase n=1 Tax=Butyrivibrio sp. TaxID=28121 RepID=UPI0025C46B8E|nr:undecaprenyldiphospho-muramoylpentapeptide beta-N-acetylglucosaminyltransferase [Butyrivibrio sp.]MBE5838273.1 undecaprenyldiphospho-muramoylpentapeptide beta-N-acetylglucosaminyltransferase [Butyrivibrio sp.]MBQ9301727.1 undecaprenyldiphospho-muramoylpentapeptide beta-N-acetylglucosaminyltransferase [Butyrivibrio sp.]